MKTGMILEGGAMRGLFTAGVIDVLMEQGIQVDGVIGVSAGAAFGCNYKSRQIGRVLRYTTTYARDPRYGGIRSLIKTGDIYGAEFCYHEIPEKLDLFDEETYRSNKVDFYVTCTDVATGQPVYHKCETTRGDDLEWIRASASMPMVSRVVKIGEKELLDGGISDSIPLAYFQSMGYEKNIVVLTQPRGYTKKKNKALPLMRWFLKKYPNVVETMAHRHEQYNETLDFIKKEEEKGKVLVICPEEALNIGRMEKQPEKLTEVYEKGRKVAEQQLEKIKAFLK